MDGNLTQREKDVLALALVSLLCYLGEHPDDETNAAKDKEVETLAVKLGVVPELTAKCASLFAYARQQGIEP